MRRASRTSAKRRAVDGAAEALWEGVDSGGSQARHLRTTLEKPLGSGHYRVREFVPGRFDSPGAVKIGDATFTQCRGAILRRLRYEYFRDCRRGAEAFKGDQVDWRTENSAKNWATPTIFSVHRKARGAGEFQSQLRHHAGVRLEHPPTVQRSAVAGRMNLRSISER